MIQLASALVEIMLGIYGLTFMVREWSLVLGIMCGDLVFDERLRKSGFVDR